MVALYIRTKTRDGRRTWKKVGQVQPLPGRFLIHLEVYPGKVYLDQISNDDRRVSDQ